MPTYAIKRPTWVQIKDGKRTTLRKHLVIVKTGLTFDEAKAARQQDKRLEIYREQEHGSNDGPVHFTGE